MTKITCPLEVEILLKYHCDPDPDIDMNAPAYADAVCKFVELGILIKLPSGKIEPNSEATAAFVNKLKQIELPKLKWV